MNKLFKALAILTSCASIAAVGGLVACSSSSDNPTPSEGLYYELDSSGEYYVAAGVGTCTDSDIVIAAEYNGLPVKEIKNFNTPTNYAYLTSVYVPDGVEAILNSTFYGNIKLTEVRLPDSITYIDDYAFYDCTLLTEINLTDNLTYVGKNAFECCTNLKSVYIGDGVTEIKQDTFSVCTSLTDVTIGNNVTVIGQDAFWECTSLVNVTMGSNIKEIGMRAFAYCTSLKEITIPASVELIKAYAFNGCESLESVTLEKTEGWKFYYIPDFTIKKVYSTELNSYAIYNPRTVAAMMSLSFEEYYWENV